MSQAQEMNSMLQRLANAEIARIKPQSRPRPIHVDAGTWARLEALAADRGQTPELVAQELLKAKTRDRLMTILIPAFRDAVENTATDLNSITITV